MSKAHRDQFDLFSSQQERDEALAQVAHNSGAWFRQAYNLVRQIEYGAVVTGEDVRRRLYEMGCPKPHHHNVWGALINKAVIRHVLTDTGVVAHMRSRTSHARRTPVYRRG